MIAEGHSSRDGYKMTARMRLPDGTPLVLEEEGPDMEEVQRRLLAKIDAWFKAPPPQSEKEPAE